MSWEVLAFRYATREATKAELYYRYAAYGEPDAEIGMDYFFWVLRDGERTVLVDTGYSVEAGERRGRTTLAVLRPADGVCISGTRRRTGPTL